LNTRLQKPRSTIISSFLKRWRIIYRRDLIQGFEKVLVLTRFANAWYGQAFVTWTRQGFDWLDKVEGEKALVLPYYIRPLNVLKQVLVMAVAMAGERSLKAHRELRRFLLNPRLRYLPADYRTYVYFGMKGQLRFTGGMAILDTAGQGSDYIIAEIALPPFGYCVTRPVGNRPSLAGSKGLYDISWFSNYGFNEWTQIHLRIPTRETHFPGPLDYRNSQGEERLSAGDSWGRSIDRNADTYLLETRSANL
jgi:hypothetical protein